jgi:hypothetical protein
LERNSYLAKTLDHESIVACLKRICDDWSAKNLQQPIGETIKVKDAVYKILKEVYK